MPEIGRGDRYPRQCLGLSGPHLIQSPDDEYKGLSCLICYQAKMKRYQQTPKGKLAKAKADQKYGKSPTGSIIKTISKRKYKKTPRGKETELRYLQSEIGRETAIRKTNRYRARKNRALHEPYTLDQVYAKTNGRCFYNPSHLATTADHVVPLSRGGTDTLDNLVPACKYCNSSKSDKLLNEWIKYA